jgi:hypothetical protein
MRKRPRGYQVYAEGAKACHEGLPRTTRVYRNDRYLKSCWLSGWDNTNAFRQNNLMGRSHGPMSTMLVGGS